MVDSEWMVYNVLHIIMLLLPSGLLLLVHYKFKWLVLGRCLESGVWRFLTPSGIKNEESRLLFPGQERARLDEAVARLNVNNEPLETALARLSASILYEESRGGQVAEARTKSQGLSIKRPCGAQGLRYSGC